LENELAGGRKLWAGAPAVRALADKLVRFSGLPATDVPLGLNAELRPYQIEGLSWLRFLAESGLSGILADDMGLGKTVQVLAWLVGEKEAGRLQHPALVVCPKSVLPNWAAEAQRFAPGLRQLVHAGPERGKRHQALAQADLVLTTYPVLARDADALALQPFDLVVLDESQMVKNPATLAARAARKLNARQRVCLTGTPLENHLGELWAQFDFLLPGLLGSKVDFTRNFRKPIEKGRDRDVRDRLRRRIRPFLLRRTKDQVVADLPRKTEVTRSIALEGKQRDLYDTLRAAYAEEVRGYIASQSFERNRMRVLEGLMRLRQVCCDPRLVSKERTRAGLASAKLDYLLDMLQELILAGRRILVFSQFTSMLELIEAELHAKRIRYVKLTGQTEDRATPVQRFQRGEVPLFLISLRAGGFGLNLTQADTVVHYDPWWNPAVEAQATDRAHRIGQEKPVFVYRLIAADTVEERILALQARKRELADALFDESGQSLASSLSADDWLSLLD
jgi:SNF2 family DNA or RNA helicase